MCTIKSAETGFPAFVVYPDPDGGFRWRLQWRYSKVSEVFSTVSEAVADAKEYYEKLREDTATTHVGRRGEFKEYHI